MLQSKFCQCCIKDINDKLVETNSLLQILLVYLNGYSLSHYADCQCRSKTKNIQTVWNFWVKTSKSGNKFQKTTGQGCAIKRFRPNFSRLKRILLLQSERGVLRDNQNVSCSVELQWPTPCCLLWFKLK